MKTINDCYTLNNGVKIPCVGFGTYKSTSQNNSETVELAIKAGYRYFDTASFYGNEEYIAEGIQKSGLKREDFFIASKLWKSEMGYEAAQQAFVHSLQRLHTEYIDLYMIHWPIPEPGYKDWKRLDIETWRALEEIYRQGKIKAIGVSNFLPHHLDNILEHCDIKPAVDQLEIHPGYVQEAAVQHCQRHDIRVQAWSPIARMRTQSEPLLCELAEKYHVSQAQLALRYEVQRGIIPLPKSSSLERMKENMDLFGFEISQEDMYRLTTLPQMGWSGEHPDRERVKI